MDEPQDIEHEHQPEDTFDSGDEQAADAHDLSLLDELASRFAAVSTKDDARAVYDDLAGNVKLVM